MSESAQWIEYRLPHGTRPLRAKLDCNGHLDIEGLCPGSTRHAPHWECISQFTCEGGLRSAYIESVKELCDLGHIKPRGKSKGGGFEYVKQSG